MVDVDLQPHVLTSAAPRSSSRPAYCSRLQHVDGDGVGLDRPRPSSSATSADDRVDGVVEVRRHLHGQLAARPQGGHPPRPARRRGRAPSAGRRWPRRRRSEPAGAVHEPMSPSSNRSPSTSAGATASIGGRRVDAERRRRPAASGGRGPSAGRRRSRGRPRSTPARSSARRSTNGWSRSAVKRLVLRRATRCRLDVTTSGPG